MALTGSADNFKAQIKRNSVKMVQLSASPLAVYTWDGQFGSTDNYVTGGVAVDFAVNGLSVFAVVDAKVITKGYTCQYDGSTGKLKIYSGTSELSNNSTALRSLKVSALILAV